MAYPLCPSFNMRRRSLIASMFVGLSLDCALTVVIFWYEMIITKCLRDAVAVFVVESILGPVCYVAPVLCPGNGYSVHSYGRGSRLWIRFSLFVAMIRRSILDGKNLQNIILPHVKLCCIDYQFSSAWLSTRCDHFLDSLKFEHRFWEGHSHCLFLFHDTA